MNDFNKVTRVAGLIKTADEAVAQIYDDATIFISGSGGGLLESSSVLAALGKRFKATGSPRNLTLVHALGIGDAKETGLESIAYEGLIKRVIGGHWSWSKKMQQLAFDNKIEAFCLPAGVITNLMRESGAGRPGLITETGLDTFVDPLQLGGRVNQKARESGVSFVTRVELDGKTYLHYKAIKIDFSFIRGSLADCHGNISLGHEAANLEAYAGALVGHNSGGRVIVQVKKVIDTPIMPSRLAQVPGILVSDIVISKKQTQTYASEYDSSLSGETLSNEVWKTPEEKDPAKWIIAYRAFKELKENSAVNFGFGIPALIPYLAKKNNFTNYWTTVEQGIHGGILQAGAFFGMAKNPMAIISSNDQFDFYDGGGNDMAFLGMGEMDEQGNVNVSKLGKYVVGPGGFINIAQNVPKIIFCGTFTTKGLKIKKEGNGVSIISEGEIQKMKKQVKEITYSGKQAKLKNRTVMYITERAVFEFKSGKIHLTEVAEGVDLEKDILQQMEFRPQVGELKKMNIS